MSIDLLRRSLVTTAGNNKRWLTVKLCKEKGDKDVKVSSAHSSVVSCLNIGINNP